jgi:DNA-binding CsgD family transcriptional regulator
MDTPARHRTRLLAFLTACGASFVVAAAVYAALWTPGTLDLSIAHQARAWPVISWVAPNGPAWSAGVMPGDTITDGASRTGLAARLVVQGHGRRITLGPEMTAVAPLDMTVCGLGLCVVLVGALVLAKGRDRRATLAFWRMSTTIGLALGAVPAGYHGVPWAVALAFVALTLFGPALVSLTLMFPSATAPRRRSALLWAPALGLLLFYPFCWWRPAPLFPLAEGAFNAALAGYILAACARLVWVQCRPRSTLQKVQLRLLAFGLVGGFAPLALLNLLPTALIGHDLVPAQLSILSLVVLPLSVGAAIVRTEFLGIPGLVRRRTLHAVVSMILLASLAAVGGLCSAAGPQRWDWPRPLSAAGISVLVALSFIALHPALTRWVERLVLRDVYDSADTLRRVSLDLAQAPPSAVGALVITRLSNVLDLTDTLLLTPTNQWSYAHPRTADPVLVQEAVIQRALHLFVEPPQGCGAFVEWAAGQPILFLPVWDGPDLQAVLCLGPKRSEDCYTKQDHALLETLVRHLGLIFSNQRLQARLEARPVVQTGLLPAPDVDAHACASEHTHTGPPLSLREMETLRYLAEGLGNREIAARMFVVEKTVQKHVAAILDKLDVRNRTQAVTIARRTGLLPPT